jgi:hypothetical protein
MAYRSSGRFGQALTRLDTPPRSRRHHPDSTIALAGTPDERVVREAVAEEGYKVQAAA